jgi:hypothetical protein
MIATATKNPPEVLHEYRMHCHAVLIGHPNREFSQFTTMHNGEEYAYHCRINRRRIERLKQRLSYTLDRPWLVYPNPQGLMLAAPLSGPHLPHGFLSFRASVSRVGTGSMSIYVRRNLKKDKRFHYLDFEIPDGLLLPEGLKKFDRVEGMATLATTPGTWQLITISQVEGGAA